jgi:hypothetical protein
VGLADQVFTALSANDYGVFDGLVAAMAPALWRYGGYGHNTPKESSGSGAGGSTAESGRTGLVARVPCAGL